MGEEAKEQAPAEAKLEEKAEEKKEEKTETKEEKAKETPAAEETKEEPKPPAPFVLFVDLHCVGCAKKIEKSIMRIRGVEGVTTDMTQNQVTIKGIVEPHAVCNKIMKKTKRRAKVLSPLPETEGAPMPEVVTSQVSGATTVELDVNMHCEACAGQLKRKILKMRGVQTAVTDLSAGKVTVTGTMDANRLVDYVYRRTKKQARIVPQPEPEPEKPEEKPAEEPKSEEKPEEKEGGAENKEEEKPPEEAKKEEGEKEANATESKEGEEEPKKEEVVVEENIISVEEENMKRMMYYYQPLYVIERIPPPQIFSDENPNACCIT